MTSIYAELCIYGRDLIPGEVSSVLGVVPSKAWVRGDVRNPRTGAVREEGCWKTCTAESGSPLDEHVQVLIRRLAECADMLPAFAAQRGFMIEVSAVVRGSDFWPDLSLSNEALQWMGGLGARLDVDLLYL